MIDLQEILNDRDPDLREEWPLPDGFADCPSCMDDEMVNPGLEWVCCERRCHIELCHTCWGYTYIPALI